MGVPARRPVLSRNGCAVRVAESLPGAGARLRARPVTRESGREDRRLLAEVAQVIALAALAATLALLALLWVSGWTPAPGSRAGGLAPAGFGAPPPACCVVAP